jgi:ABC-type dipeptide/oligopeptide/nickel transport system permease subunit
MPLKEIIRLMLKRRLAVACFGIIVISAFFALTARVWVPEPMLRAQPGVDTQESALERIAAQRAHRSFAFWRSDEEKQERAKASVEKSYPDGIAVTGLERSFHPPGWWLALNPDHPHWEKTGATIDGPNPPVPMEERDISLLSAEAWRFPMGCDVEGVSILAKLTRGLQMAFIIGIVPTIISSIIAVMIGLIAGFYGKLIDDAIVYVISTVASIPLLLLLIAFIQAVRNHEGAASLMDTLWIFGELDHAWRNVMLVLIVIGLITWTELSRLVRAEVMKHKDREYVQAARALGFGARRILLKHMLPNVFHIVIIYFTLSFVGVISLEVFLSFVGIGVEATLPTWGQMITGARTELQREPSVWWPLTFATLALFILSLAVSLFGDALRDTLDPKLRSK